MKIIQELLSRKPLRMERPTWLVTCSLKRRESFGTVSSTARYELAATSESFGTVSSTARYELAATSEDEARCAVREFVQQAHPRCSIESMQVSRQAWAHSN